jgi:chemotaxis-related protein WspD
MTPLPGDNSPTENVVATANGDCWNQIGVAGDRSCPELITHIHCRNCPVFATAARAFLDRPAPDGYLADWGRWLAESNALSQHSDEIDAEKDQTREAHRGGTSVLIFRLGTEWLAFPTETVAEVTTPKPVHRIPHRSNQVLAGIVSLHGQATLAVSLHGLLGVGNPGSAPHLVVLRDASRACTWVFPADEVLGVRRVPRGQWHAVPSTLVNPAVGFSQAVISWDGRSIGLLDAARIFAALGELGN